MILLLVLLLILISIAFKIKRTDINLLPVIVVFLILIAGLKNNYTYDFENYLINFTEINGLNDILATNFEIGYAILVFIFKSCGLGFHTLLLFIAFLSIKMKWCVIDKYSPLPEVSLLIYFLLFYVFNDLEQIRHGLSVGLCFYSLIYLDDKESKLNIKFVSLNIVAILFHYSAILFLPFIFVRDHIFKKRIYFAVIAIAIVLSMINLVDVLNTINTSFLHSSYITSKLELYSNESSTLISSTLIIKVFIFSMFYIYAYDSNKKLHRILMNMYFYGIIITLIFNSIPIVVSRSSLYMRYAEILMIPIYLNTIPKLSNKKIHSTIVIFIFSYYFIKFLQVIIVPEYFFYNAI